MAGPTPPGFNRDEVLAGLYTAMRFGAPTRDEDKPTFYTIPDPTVVDPHSDEDVPFDPAVRVDRTPTAQQVDCAYEFDETSIRISNSGELQPSRVTITMLDDEYQEVRGFDFVAIGGQKYQYSKTEGPVALGTIDVWTVYCRAEDIG